MRLITLPTLLRVAFVLIVSSLLVAGAQETYTLKVNTQLVIRTVSVKDQNGKPMEDLTAKDFIVTEDGVPQTLSVFEFQKLDDAPVSRPTEQRLQPSIRNQIEPERAGDIRYADRRLLVLYFDMSAMGFAERLRALAGANKFIRTQMTGADLMSVMLYGGGVVKVLEDFTDDRDRLASTLALIERAVLGEDVDSSAFDAGDAFGQDSGEFNLFNTDRQLSALQTAVTMLGTLREQKSFIYIAGGLRLNGTDNLAQLRATVNAATRANVSFYPIDARGLVARAPLGDATQASPGGVGMYSGALAIAAMTNFQRSQDSLYALAADTGGKAMFDYNDLSLGMVQAQQGISSYYILGYYSTNTALDGRYRRVQIKLRETAAKLVYSDGYYAGKEFKKFTSTEKERQLEEALMLGDPITDLPIAMEVNYFQLNRDQYFVSVFVKIPGSELVLAKKGGAERTVIDFIGEIKDEFGYTIQNVRDKVDMKLSEETASQLAMRPIQYDMGFTLLPAKYTIKFLARDAETGRIGTYQTNFVVPNLNQEEKRVPTSSVILSSQRVDMKDALYNVRKQDMQAANPLVRDGQKLIPSVTRVFSKSGDMYVFLQAYQQDRTTSQSLLAFVTFYRGKVKTFETAPLAVTQSATNSRAVSLRFNFALGELSTGQYECQVTVLDSNQEKASFWRVPIALVP